MATGAEGNAEDAQLREVFDVCDLDHNGKISLAELQLVIGESGTNLSDAEVADIFRRLDVNTDGEIDFQEFKKGYSQIFGGGQQEDEAAAGDGDQGNGAVEALPERPEMDAFASDIQKSLDDHNAEVRKERDALLEQNAKLTRELAERSDELEAARAQLRDKAGELRRTGAEADDIIERIRKEKDAEMAKIKSELLAEQVRAWLEIDGSYSPPCVVATRVQQVC